MPAFVLVLEKHPSKAEWLLEWNDVKFVLKDPEGQIVLDADAAYAHRLVEILELYGEGKISFATPEGSLAFKKNRPAVAELRQFVETGLASDVEYRRELRTQALRAIPLGLGVFVVAGGLFGLFCWYAIGAPNPPPGHWIRWIGWLIHVILLVLLAAALAGPFVAYFGLRQWMRIRRIERRIAMHGNTGPAPGEN